MMFLPPNFLNDDLTCMHHNSKLKLFNSEKNFNLEILIYLFSLIAHISYIISLLIFCSLCSTIIILSRPCDFIAYVKVFLYLGFKTYSDLTSLLLGPYRLIVLRSFSFVNFSFIDLNLGKKLPGIHRKNIKLFLIHFLVFNVSTF